MKRADSKLFVMGNRNRNRRITGTFLHHDVATAAANFPKTVCRKNRTSFRARQDAEPTQR